MLAKQEGAVLIVTEITRLFRDPELGLQKLSELGVPVFSLEDDKIMTRRDMLKGFSAGRDFAEKTRSGTREKLADLKSQGAQMGAPKNLSLANRNSVLSRKRASLEITDTIADLLAEDPAYGDLTHRGFSDLLNRRGIRSGWGRAWTPGALRRQLKLAREILAERETLQSEIDAEPVPEFKTSTGAPLTKVEGAADEESLPATNKLPTFGMF